MAKFITTKRTVVEIEDLIKDAGDKLMLISPYWKLTKDLEELLFVRNKKAKVTTVICRKRKLNTEVLNFLQDLQFVDLRYSEDLHAKCYANDRKMVITSLNLYEFSIENNKEMGVLIDKNDPADGQLFSEAMKEMEFIYDISQEFEPNITQPTNRPIIQNAKSISVRKNTGFCIRTGVEIPFNFERPLSYDAYKKWNEYADPSYPEKFCHYSGQLSYGETSVDKPVLRKYWKLAQETYGSFA